ncbi:hypothetical protein DFH09DRAFT_1106022 [Mycena vulgaris]|nr:hypothetical protein DFH09DRAFT_1106022 [Mycena vulgaris]
MSHHYSHTIPTDNMGRVTTVPAQEKPEQSRTTSAHLGIQFLPYIMALDASTLPIVDPIFLPELEQNIFLILVARRVQEWHLIPQMVKPLLYHVVFSTALFPPPDCHSTLLGAIKREPASFFGRAVRHFYLAANVLESEAQTILSACSGITNLCAPTHLTAHHEYLGDLPLRRMTLTLQSPISFTHSMFRHVTHLEVLEPRGGFEGQGPIDGTGWATLPLMPHLAPLAFSSVKLAASLPHILLTLDTTQAVDICAVWSPDDVRFVTMREVPSLPADWKHVAETGHDFWVRAEELGAAKRAAKVQPMDRISVDPRPLELPDPSPNGDPHGSIDGSCLI